MISNKTIWLSILDYIDSIDYHAKNGYTSKGYSLLYPDPMGIESSVTTTGETLVPALNIMSKESFDELLSKEYDPAFVYKIGSLEFFDEYCGDPITTVIVVLSDYGAELYRR